MLLCVVVFTSWRSCCEFLE